MELGASLDASKPGLYLGLGLEIRRFVRLGVGATMQVVNRLADGLSVGTPVFGPEDVLTQKEARFCWYAGITFGLDALPIFSPSK